MNAPAMPPANILIIGAGPAGLMAAETLAAKGYSVQVHEKMPSVARKFLMAGRGGLNLTHSEPRPDFDGRYGQAASLVGRWLDRFDAAALVKWANGLGQETFVGSSRRIFPKAMKASPLLRAWLARLEKAGVRIHTRSEWVCRDKGDWLFDTPQGHQRLQADAVILATGGASWGRLGADGAWVPWIRSQGVAVTPFCAANAGFKVEWSSYLRDSFAGTPLKSVGLRHNNHQVRGEVMLSAYGVEGGAIYALSAALRQSIADHGHADLMIDLRPDQSVGQLVQKLSRPRGKNSVSNHLRKALNLDGAAAAVLRDAGPLPSDPLELAQRIKALPVRLVAMQGLERAISAAGGVMLDQLDEHLMLRAMPGVFACGEMLDWEAPTGGYLLQACFASGVVVAEGVDHWLRNDR